MEGTQYSYPSKPAPSIDVARTELEGSARALRHRQMEGTQYSYPSKPAQTKGILDDQFKLGDDILDEDPEFLLAVNKKFRKDYIDSNIQNMRLSSQRAASLKNKQSWTRTLFGTSKADKKTFKSLIQTRNESRKAALIEIRKGLVDNLNASEYRYFENMSKSQKQAFENLALNVNPGKQIDAYTDMVKKASARNLKWIDDPLNDLKPMGRPKSAETVPYSSPRGRYSRLSDSSKPRIEIGRKASRSTGTHEAAHFVDDNTGFINATYKKIKQQVSSTNLDQFLNSDTMQTLLNSLQNYTSKELRSKPNEIFTVLNQAASDIRTRDIFDSSSEARGVLGDLWKARGFEQGGLVSSAQKEIIGDILDSNNPSLAYANSMKLGLSISDASKQAMLKSNKKYDKKSTKEQLLRLVSQSEMNKRAKQKLYKNNKNVGGIVYANNGALISAQNQGTDSVPAMLTPGEFVVNRNMAQKHMPILHAINKGYYNQGGMVQYLNNGGVVSPKYYSAGSVNPLSATREMSTSRSSGGVNTNGSSSSAPGWLSELDNKVNSLSSAINEGLQNMFSNLSNVANQLTNVAQELPREMSINSNISKTLSVNGISGEWNKYQGDVLKMAGEQESESRRNDKIALSKWSEGQIPVV
jgi:uncharacterized protein YjgD (DUF1641 family)